MTLARALAFADFLNVENWRADAAIKTFIDLPASEWPRFLRSDHASTYGFLNRLVDLAHEELDRDANKALAWTRIVLRNSQHVFLPPDSDLHLRRLRGKAWKDHGSALFVKGRTRLAQAVLRRAVRVLTTNGDLLKDERGAAMMVQVDFARRLRDFEKALTLIRSCRAIFQELNDKNRLLQVAVFEAVVLYERGDYDAAWLAFHDARHRAEVLENRRELARIQLNIGLCDIKRGNPKDAIPYLQSARQAFEREQMTADRVRADTGRARALRDLGRFGEAKELCRMTRSEFLSRGMIIVAAYVALDLIQVLVLEENWNEVIAEAKELVDVFSQAGMNHELRIAMSYLAEAARTKRENSAEFMKSVSHVRDFLDELALRPDATFAAV